MRRLAVFCVVLLISGCANMITPTDTEDRVAVATSAETAESLGKIKKRLLILNFINKGRNGGGDLASLATSHTKSFLTGVDEVSLLRQEDLDNTESFLNQDGDFDMKNIFETARAHNISGVLTGTIRDVSIHQSGEEIGLFRMREFAVNATVRVSLYDTTTEREVYTKTMSADVTEEHTEFFNERNVDSYDAQRGKIAVSKALDQVIAELPLYAKKLGWTGRIAKVDLRRYYINAGELTGLSRGQLLKVYGEGQPIYDPDNNVLLGIAPGRFKGLLKIVDYFGQDGAVAILHSGAGFKVKDRVEIFSNVQNQ